MHHGAAPKHQTPSRDVLADLIGVPGARNRLASRTISRTIANELLEHAPEVIRGTPSKRIHGVHDEVLGKIALEPHLSGDGVFTTFARKMCIIPARRIGWTGESLHPHPETTAAFIEHMEAHDEILKEAQVPRTVMTEPAPKFTLWQIGAI